MQSGIRAMPETGDIVRVDWWDIKEFGATEYSEWSPDELPLWGAVSYGEFLCMDEEKLVISREHIGDDVDRQVFPIGCVKKVTVLHEAKDL